MSEWGVLPEAAIARIKALEWSNDARLRARLSGARPFPLRLALKAPTGAQALADLDRFRRFVDAWKRWPHAGQVRWQSKRYQRLGEQQVPVRLEIVSMAELIALLGPAAEARRRSWEARMRPLLSFDPRLSQVLIRHLSVIEQMATDDIALLVQLLPQLRRGMGHGDFLRALPLAGVDTKFVESHQRLIADLLDCLTDGAVSEQGGLARWLDCAPLPSGWLLVRPLCSRSRERLAGLSILQMDSASLRRHPLPASRILVVENAQSGYALPSLADTIAVFGGGRNTAWMGAPWLRERLLGYWGDIDGWGLTILSDARCRQPRLHALMMDEETVLRHRSRMVDEANPPGTEPEHLLDAERLLFRRLHEAFYGRSRLEQERLAADFVHERLEAWAAL